MSHKYKRNGGVLLCHLVHGDFTGFHASERSNELILLRDDKGCHFSLFCGTGTQHHPLANESERAGFPVPALEGPIVFEDAIDQWQALVVQIDYAYGDHVVAMISPEIPPKGAKKPRHCVLFFRYRQMDGGAQERDVVAFLHEVAEQIHLDDLDRGPLDPENFSPEAMKS